MAIHCARQSLYLFPSPITQGSLTEQEALCQLNSGTPQTLTVAKINRKKRAKRSSKVRPLGVRVTKKKRSNVVSALLNKMGQLGKLPCTKHSITHIAKQPTIRPVTWIV